MNQEEQKENNEEEKTEENTKEKTEEKTEETPKKSTSKRKKGTMQIVNGTVVFVEDTNAPNEEEERRIIYAVSNV